MAPHASHFEAEIVGASNLSCFTFNISLIHWWLIADLVINLLIYLFIRRRFVDLIFLSIDSLIQCLSVWLIDCAVYAVWFRAVLHPDDTEARSAMNLTATYAGIGFGNAGVHLWSDSVSLYSAYCVVHCSLTACLSYILPCVSCWQLCVIEHIFKKYSLKYVE